jgi:glycosyltransferase involved in cell wall biosynthesis
LKVLEICSAYPPSRGGVERFVQEVSRGLVRKGHEVTVITSSRGVEMRQHDEIGADGVRVMRLPEQFHLFEAPLMPAIAFKILARDFDIVHIHGMSPTITDSSILMGWLRRKPVVVTYHNDAEATSGWRITRLAAAGYAALSIPIMRRADVVVCSTRSYAESSPVLRHISDKLRIIPLGVEPGRFSRMMDSRSERKRREVLFVGQLKDYKGVDVLIRAIAKLRREGHDIGLQVVGEGPSLPKLKHTAKELQLNGGVRFLGNVEDEALIELYNECDLFVLPSTSRREAFGIVQLEALAAGKKVVASDIPGVGEVTKMVGGFLAKPNDHASLASEILKAIGTPHDKGRLQEMAKSLTWQNVVDSYERIFFEQLAKRRARPPMGRLTVPPLVVPGNLSLTGRGVDFSGLGQWLS